MMDSIVFYRSFYDAIEDLDDESRLEALEAIIRYGLYDEEPSLTGVCKSVFTIARPLIDANKQRAINGKKGGRPRNKKPMVIENENHRLSDSETNGYEESKPNKNKNKNKNKNLHHHDDEKNDGCNDVGHEIRHVGEGETYFNKTVKLGFVSKNG